MFSRGKAGCGILGGLWTCPAHSYKMKTMRKKLKVALLFGGRSAEHEVSITSAGAIYSHLDQNKFEITCLFINKQGQWRQVESPHLPTEELNQGLHSPFIPWQVERIAYSMAADIYFPILHGPFGEDGTIQGLFELANVPYVGATVLSSALGMDKAMAKTLFAAQQLPLVNHVVLRDHNWKTDSANIIKDIRSDFSLPFYVKPSNLGSSVGISKVKDFQQLQQAVDMAFQYDQKIIVEEGIIGQEIECSVLGNEHPRASLPGEIIPYREFYDYKDKYVEGKTTFVIPAELSSALVQKIQETAVQAFLAIECSGMARVDFFIQEKTQKVYLNEINTIPGFTQISMYPKLWEVSGIPFASLLEELIELGMEKHKNKKINLTWT